MGLTMLTMGLRVFVLAFVLAVQGACPSHCSGNGRCDDTTEICACSDGWTGADCAQPTFACERLENCNGHGLCRGGACVCDAGFQGAKCDRIASNCSHNCMGHGLCVHGTCRCDHGYEGSSCELVSQSTFGCPHNCSGHGVCVNGECDCFPGFWTGPSCADDLRLCVAQAMNCSGRGYCGSGVVGPSSAGDMCTCAPGFCSEDCSVVCPTCPNNCTGHGLCVGTTCQCSAGFDGMACDIVVPGLACPTNCSGHGRCVEMPDFSGCQCDPGFTDAACTTVVYTPVCPNNCSGCGECHPTGCHCYPGFNGTACDEALPVCNASFHCSGNGVCVNDVCSCFQGFHGYDCADACVRQEPGLLGCNEDVGNGRCFNGTCVCLPEFEGKYCENEVDEFLEPYWERRDPLGWSMIVVAPTVLAAGLFLLCHKRMKTSKEGKLDDELIVARPVEEKKPKLKPDKLVAFAKPVKLPLAKGSSALDAPLLMSPAYEVPDSQRGKVGSDAPGPTIAVAPRPDAELGRRPRSQAAGAESADVVSDMTESVNDYTMESTSVATTSMHTLSVVSSTNSSDMSGSEDLTLSVVSSDNSDLTSLSSGSG